MLMIDKSLSNHRLKYVSDYMVQYAQYTMSIYDTEILKRKTEISKV